MGEKKPGCSQEHAGASPGRHALKSIAPEAAFKPAIITAMASKMAVRLLFRTATPPGARERDHENQQRKNDDDSSNHVIPFCSFFRAQLPNGPVGRSV